MIHVAIAGEHWIVVAAGASSSVQRQPRPCDSDTKSHTALAVAIVEPCISGVLPHTSGVFQEALGACMVAHQGPGPSLAWRTGHQAIGWADRGGNPILLFARGGLPQGLAQQVHMLCSVKDVFQVSVLPLPFLWLHWRGFGPIAGLVSSWLSKGACTGALGQEASKPEAYILPCPPPLAPEVPPGRNSLLALPYVILP